MIRYCERCGISGDKIRLFDAIYYGKISILCERCSIIENIPIIKKPNSRQLKDSEENIKVFERMKRLSGIKGDVKDDIYFQEDRLKELNENPELEMPENEKLKLIDHFHWEITKNRRRKGFSVRQLAELLGESEIAIEMLEKGKLPDNADILIRKMEQIFMFKLRKKDKSLELIEDKPILLDDHGEELDFIPEDELIINGDQLEEKKEKTSDKAIEETSKIHLDESKDLNIKDIDKRITMGELKNVHKKKLEVTKQEMIDEQRKIEERKRILQALREKDRIKMERRKELERLELQKKKEDKEKELELKEQEEFNEIDKYLGGVELLNENESNSDDIK